MFHIVYRERERMKPAGRTLPPSYAMTDRKNKRDAEVKNESPEAQKEELGLFTEKASRVSSSLSFFFPSLIPAFVSSV